MEFTIYLLTNTKTLKKYIGITNNFKKRMREHSYGNNTYRIGRSINKHGWESFESQILETCQTKEEAFERETYYITKYKAFDEQFGYNLTLGGQGTYGYSPSNETRNKMRVRKLGRKLSDTHKAKIASSNTGKIVSEETKAKISAGLKNTPSRIGLMGPLSEEHKQKLSIAAKGKPKSSEHIEALREAKTGVKWTDERRQNFKMSSEWKVKLGESKAKEYVLRSPAGEIITIKNMGRFCREHNIAAPGAMMAVAKGKKPQYLGWTKP